MQDVMLTPFTVLWGLVVLPCNCEMQQVRKEQRG